MMPIHDLFYALANESLNDLARSPTLEPPEKLFLCGYTAYEAGQYVLAQRIFEQLHRAGYAPDETFYATARCLVDSGNVTEALTYLRKGWSNKFLRYFLPFLRANGHGEMADQVERELEQFFENFMAIQNAGTTHGFKNFSFPDEAVLEGYFGPLFARSEKITTALDVGCSHGAMMDFVRRRFGVASFGGVEINLPAVEEFQRKYPETFALSQVYVGSAIHYLPLFADQSMDLVYSHTVLSAVPDRAVIRHMARISGQFVFLMEFDHRNRCLLPIGNVFHDYEGILGECGFTLVAKEVPVTDTYDRRKNFRLFMRTS